MGLSPAIHVLPRSAYSEGDKARTIVRAIDMAVGVDTVIPVIYGGRVVGATYGLRGTRHVKFAPLTHKQWCGFESYEALERAVVQQQVIYTTSFKVFNVNGLWNDLWPVSGASSTPTAGGYTGAAATARQIDDTTVGAIQNHFLPGGSRTAHIFRYFFANTQNAFATFCLYDRVLTYDAEVISNVSTVMDNSLAAQRYIAAGQPGLLIMITGTTGTVLGATAATLDVLTYVDNEGNGGQLAPTDTALNWLVSSVAASGTTAAPIVCPRTNALVPGGPFLPLAPGDTGVRSITDYTSSANNTGTVCMALVRPLGWLTTQMSNAVTRFDAGRDVMALDRLYDGAALSLLIRCNQNTTQRIDAQFVWG